MKGWRRYIVASVIVTIVGIALYWQGERCDAKANECASKLALSGEANKTTSPNEAIQSCRESQSYFCRIVAPANIPNVFLVLIGMAGIIVAIGSLDILERQTKATQDSVETLINVERAWILVNTAKIANELGMIHMGDDPYYTVLIHFKNYGRTLGRITRYSVKKRILLSGEVLPREPIYDPEIRTDIACAAGKNMSLGIPKIYAEDLGLRYAGYGGQFEPTGTQNIVCIYGFVLYSIIGEGGKESARDKEKETRFCFRCTTNGLFVYSEAPKTYTDRT